MADDTDLSGRLSFIRIKELARNPIQGAFDEAHLRAVHGYIFQDSPQHSPGKLRDPARGHFKQRGLETQAQGHEVPYALRDQIDRELAPTLKALDGGRAFAGKDVLETAESLAQLYGKLDYLHPFKEGNSRTLRAFTAQLTAVNGHKLDWNASNADGRSRDALYIARDIEVLKQHYPGITPQDTNTTDDRARYFAAFTLARHDNADPLKELIRQSLERGLKQAPEAKSFSRDKLIRQQEFVAPIALIQAERGFENLRLAELRGKASKDQLAQAGSALELTKTLADPERFRDKLTSVKSDQFSVEYKPGETSLSRLAGVNNAIARELRREQQVTQDPPPPPKRGRTL